jgi:hypothetical protein
MLLKSVSWLWGYEKERNEEGKKLTSNKQKEDLTGSFHVEIVAHPACWPEGVELQCCYQVTVFANSNTYLSLLYNSSAASISGM